MWLLKEKGEQRLQRRLKSCSVKASRRSNRHRGRAALTDTRLLGPDQSIAVADAKSRFTSRELYPAGPGEGRKLRAEGVQTAEGVEAVTMRGRQEIALRP